MEGIRPEPWQIWSRFLAAYAHAVRSQPLLDRGQFLVTLRGGGFEDLPEEDVCLSIHAWREVVDPTDVLLHSALTYRGRAGGELGRRLAVAAIASLAGWDPITIESFSDTDAAQIMEPVDALAAMGKQRGWDRGAEAAWADGSRETLDGRAQTHSALLACRGDPGKEIRRRLWSAQVGVLLPYIEEMRRGFIERFARSLRVPWRTRFGEVILTPRAATDEEP